MPIKLLNDALINKIAAGEVIEKPASVVKELLENSLDAGASAIKISIAGGGLQVIDIEDDGSGLRYEEIPLAFLRHATSKLSSEDDLFNINTMGFRGEALPSIASVARIEVFSKAEDADGVYARLESGQVEEIKYHPCPEGTRMIIRDLFFNTPARKKFIKSPVSEGNHVYDVMVKYALARPEVSFTFSNDKKTFFKTPGNGRLRDTVIAIYGSDFAGHMLDIDYHGENASLGGLVGGPELTRVNRKHEFFCVNHRPVRSPMVFRALDAAYSGLLLAREYPVVILNMSLPPHTIDVNVHPQKNEIRFQDEKAVFDLLHGVLRDQLRQADFSPREAIFPSVSPWTADKSLASSSYRQHVAEGTFNRPGWDQLSYEPGSGFQTKLLFSSGSPDFQAGINQTNYLTGEISGNEEAINISPGQELRVIAQTLNSYILIEFDDALWLVDQHAAHERIIYSRLLDSAANKDDPAQILALPLTLDLSSRDMDLVEQNQELFSSLGFKVEAMGPNTLVIRSSPVLVAGSEDEVIGEILELIQGGHDVRFKEKAFAMMACKKAIKAGESLNHNEMEKLVIDLLDSSDYKNCPHGRPTMVRLSHHDLDRMFKR